MSSLEPATRERLELETRVLAAALRLSLEIGDSEGSSLAHEQIFRLLKACQEIGETDSLAQVQVLPEPEDENQNRKLPEIDWFAPSVEARVDARPRQKPISEEIEEPVDSFYDLLGARDDDTGERVHLCFLLKVRRMLRHIAASTAMPRAEKQKTLKRLQAYWIAHDVLSDTRTREEYGSRREGQRESSDTAGGEATMAPVSLRIGELLETSGLLEKTELEIAADMHKAMPEMMFGAFLVKQGFVKEDDLECVLIGQALIKTGEMDLKQFQEVMELRAASPTIKLSQLLVEQSLASPERVAEVLLSLPVEEVGLGELAEKQENDNPTAPPQEVKIPAVSAPGLSDWKSQLDWSSPVEEVVEATEKERSQADTGALEPLVLEDVQAETQDISQDVVTAQEEVDEIEEEPRQARRNSLLDLMVDIGSAELEEKEEAEEEHGLLSSVLEESEAAEPSLDSVLFGAPQEAASVPNTPPESVDNKDVAVKGETAEEVFFGDDDHDDVSRLDAAVEEVLDLPDPGEEKSTPASKDSAGKDSWSIVSIPASYLASYLMEEDDTTGSASTERKTPPEEREKSKFRRRRTRS